MHINDIVFSCWKGLNQCGHFKVMIKFINQFVGYKTGRLCRVMFWNAKREVMMLLK